MAVVAGDGIVESCETDENPRCLQPPSVPLSRRFRRSGDGSRRADSQPTGDQSHSRRFLMKTSLKATSDVALEGNICP